MGLLRFYHVVIVWQKYSVSQTSLKLESCSWCTDVQNWFEWHPWQLMQMTWLYKPLRFSLTTQTMKIY